MEIEIEILVVSLSDLEKSIFFCILKNVLISHYNFRIQSKSE